MTAGAEAGEASPEMNTETEIQVESVDQTQRTDQSSVDDATCIIV